MKVHFIVSCLPPQMDGIGDYTSHIAAEIACANNVKILTGQKTPPAPIPGVEIAPVFSFAKPSSIWSIVPIIEADRPDWVVLQYNPWSFGRWGRNLSLPEAMSSLKRRCPGTKFALMVHEPFVPFTNWQFCIMTTWQRWQLWRLGSTADIVFLSIEPWARKFRRWFRGKQVLHLPVGSNMPFIPTEREEARQRLGIANDTCVLGLFGTMHVSRMTERIREAVDALHATGRTSVVVYVGPEPHLFRRALPHIASIAEGPFPGEEVSRRFAAMDILLAPFADGISTRRGSVMGGLQHGLPIVGTRGPSTDDILNDRDGEAFLLADVRDGDHFSESVVALMEDDSRRGQMGLAARHLYDSEFSWPVIGERMMNALSTAG